MVLHRLLLRGWPDQHDWRGTRSIPAGEYRITSTARDPGWVHSIIDDITAHSERHAYDTNLHVINDRDTAGFTFQDTQGHSYSLICGGQQETSRSDYGYPSEGNPVRRRLTFHDLTRAYRNRFEFSTEAAEVAPSSSRDGAHSQSVGSSSAE